MDVMGSPIGSDGEKRWIMRSDVRWSSEEKGSRGMINNNEGREYNNDFEAKTELP